MKGAAVGTLGAGLVAGEAVQESGGLGIGEVVERAEGGFRFYYAETVEIPGGVEDLVKGELFDGALGIELSGEGSLESFEFLPLIPADDEVFGGETVLEGVLSDARFTFGRYRPGGVPGVGAVGGDLSGDAIRNPFDNGFSMSTAEGAG